jgi:hypothetical protein
MPKYVVQIEAENFLIEVDGVVAKRGFITFKCVEAEDAESAELTAVQMIRDDQELRPLVQNEVSDPPCMSMISIHEVESFDEVEGLGKIWYEMNPKRWWQFWRR